MAARRIYVVTETDGKMQTEFLVAASSQSQAVGHVVRGRFSAEPANGSTVARLMGGGKTVQEAGDE